MRLIKFAGLFILICFLVSTLAAAGEKPMGIANTYHVSFTQAFRVADTLLPQGNYEIRHVMEGDNHIMVFHQLGVWKPVDVRAKCTLVPLTEKAKDTQKTYTQNAANEWVLQELIFKGDSAKHVF